MIWTRQFNKWIDSLPSYGRFYFLIGMVTVAFIIEWFIGIKGVGMLIIAIIGLVRIGYFIVEPKRKRNEEIKNGKENM